jgi:phosphomethylpyrimidine synthase
MTRPIKLDSGNADVRRKTMKQKSGVRSQKSKEKIEQTSDSVRLPASQKIYVETNGSAINQNKHNLRVPFREIALSPSKDFDGELEENAPVRVYDTSGPWTDHDQKHNVRDGLPALRCEWIVARGDVEEYEGREIGVSSPHVSKGSDGQKEPSLTFGLLTQKRAPLRAKAGSCVTQIHYARKGIITPEMEYIAIRENLGRKIAFETLANEQINDRSSLYHQHQGESFGAAIPKFVTPEFVAGRLFRITSIIPNPNR